MPLYHTLLIESDEQAEETACADFLHIRAANFGYEENLEDKRLENLVYQLVKTPEDLSLHLQRIYATYRLNQPEQLYAAFVDFLSTLAGKGRKLAWRMLNAARSGLGEEQFQVLSQNIKGHGSKRLPVNAYSVLAEELVGSSVMVEKRAADQLDHDYLKLAHDYIEYSQLDSAMDLLEEGVEKIPSREDLQELLLELYRLTNNEQRFREMYASAMSTKIHLLSGWKKLAEYFDGRKK